MAETTPFQQQISDHNTRYEHVNYWLNWTKELLDETIQAKDENTWTILQESPIWVIAVNNTDRFDLHTCELENLRVVLDKTIADTCYKYALEVIRDVREHVKLPKIITFTGKSGSGKDTCADYLVENLTKNGFKAQRVGVADRLKIIVQQLIKIFYGTDLPIEHFYDLKEKEKYRTTGVCEELSDKYGFYTGYSIRWLLQMVGSEIFRDNIGEDIWCDIVHKKYVENSDYDYILISDCRFPNELAYFKDCVVKETVSKVTSIKLIRDKAGSNLATEETKMHKSEQHASTMKTDITIDNNGSLKDLYTQLDQILDTCLLQEEKKMTVEEEKETIINK